MSTFPTSIPESAIERCPDVEVEQQSKEFIRLQASRLVGAKVTVYFPSFVGKGNHSVWRGTLLDAPEAHGFVTPGGGWSLIYIPRGEDNTEFSYRVKARRERRRKISWLRLDDAVAIKMGW